MFLEKLKVVNFRNYANSETLFKTKLNLINGANAEGKTNLLEAIYLLCLGRSFRFANNQDMIKYGNDFFTVEGQFFFDNGIKKQVILQYIRDGKKEISIDRKKLSKQSQLFGQFPIVVMSPEDYKITTGSPAERRRFVDILLSQISLTYLSNLQDYARVLKQRNSILQSVREGVDISESTIEPWTNRLLTVGSAIVSQRYGFIREFSNIVNTIYKNYSASKDDLQISLSSTLSSVNQDSWIDKFRAGLAQVKNKERILGKTLVGPHRDDFIFTINGMDLKKFGSRGEHKSALISTKLAEFSIIKKRKEETPILLLDDFKSELDDTREVNVFDSLKDRGQIFFTSPKKKAFDSFEQNSEFSRFFVEDGQIEFCEL